MLAVGASVVNKNWRKEIMMKLEYAKQQSITLGKSFIQFEKEEENVNLINDKNKIKQLEHLLSQMVHFMCFVYILFIFLFYLIIFIFLF